MITVEKMTSGGLKSGEAGTASKARRILSLLKKIVPWLIAAGILIYLFASIDLNMFISSLQQAQFVPYAAALIAFVIINFLLDAQNLHEILHHFGYQVPYHDAMRIRGVSYLIMTLDYHLSLGSIAYYLKRNWDIPLIRGTALMFIFNMCTQVSLFFMGAMGIAMAPARTAVLNKIMAFCWFMIIFYVLYIVILKILPSSGRTGRFKNMALVRVYHEVSGASYAVLTFYRSLYYATFIVFYYFALRAFHMQISFSTLVAYVPVILLIMSMPVTPFGLGTAQAAMLYFFRDFGSEANILAFGIVYSTSFVLCRAVIGLFFMNRIAGAETNKMRIAQGVNS
jgi:uncharacterized membrane protein YbhN (UPF0104 family)